jgi:hypothetical protein
LEKLGVWAVLELTCLVARDVRVVLFQELVDVSEKADLKL